VGQGPVTVLGGNGKPPTAAAAIAAIDRIT